MDEHFNSTSPEAKTGKRIALSVKNAFHAPLDSDELLPSPELAKISEELTQKLTDSGISGVKITPGHDNVGAHEQRPYLQVEYDTPAGIEQQLAQREALEAAIKETVPGYKVHPYTERELAKKAQASSERDL